jgi:hypothetical protein
VRGGERCSPEPPFSWKLRECTAAVVGPIVVPAIGQAVRPLAKAAVKGASFCIEETGRAETSSAGRVLPTLDSGDAPS